MTDTIDSATREIFNAVRNVAGPMFIERGFVDVATRFEAAQNLGMLLEAIDFAEAICACPDTVRAGFHEIRTAAERIKQVRDAGGIDSNKLSFARLQAISAAGFFQDARNGRLHFEQGKPN